MRITVIGAAGRLGQQIVATAAKRGHEVTGLARHPERSAMRTECAVAVRGDARNPAAVARAVTGADVVITTLPGGDRADPHRVTDSMRTLVSAMSTLGVRRVIASSAYPIVARRPALVMAILRRVFRVAYSDAAGAEAILSGSNLEWTVVRLNRLTDALPVGRPRVSTGELDRPTGLTRSDAAGLLVDLAETGAHTATAVNVRGRDAKG